MVGLPCLMSQCSKLHVAGWTWAVFTRVYLLFLWFLQRQSGIFWIYSYLVHLLPLWTFVDCSRVNFNFLLCDPDIQGTRYRWTAEERHFLLFSLHSCPSAHSDSYSDVKRIHFPGIKVTECVITTHLNYTDVNNGLASTFTPRTFKARYFN
jgi:hypothetical protein